LCIFFALFQFFLNIGRLNDVSPFDFSPEKWQNFSAMPDRYAPASSTAKNAPSQKKKQQKSGYCIRTGGKIPFNIKTPFNKKSFASWNLYKNPEFAEKFCHFSGEKSNGETSFSRPILRKNWNKAKKMHKL
jgi:hypothetical protein